MSTVKPFSKFNMSARRVHDPEDPKQVVGYVLKSLRKTFPVKELAEGVTNFSLNKDDFGYLYKKIEDLGGKVPDTYFNYNVEVTPSHVVFSGVTETATRLGLVEYLKHKFPDKVFKMKRTWDLRLYDTTDDSSSSGAPFVDIWDNSDSDSD
jgi:hypothetical protein